MQLRARPQLRRAHPATVTRNSTARLPFPHVVHPTSPPPRPRPVVHPPNLPDQPLCTRQASPTDRCAPRKARITSCAPGVECTTHALSRTVYINVRITRYKPDLISLVYAIDVKAMAACKLVHTFRPITCYQPRIDIIVCTIAIRTERTRTPSAHDLCDNALCSPTTTYHVHNHPDRPARCPLPPFAGNDPRPPLPTKTHTG